MGAVPFVDFAEERHRGHDDRLPLLSQKLREAADAVGVGKAAGDVVASFGIRDCRAHGIAIEHHGALATRAQLLGGGAGDGAFAGAGKSGNPKHAAVVV